MCGTTISMYNPTDPTVDFTVRWSAANTHQVFGAMLAIGFGSMAWQAICNFRSNIGASVYLSFWWFLVSAVLSLITIICTFVAVAAPLLVRC